MPEPLIEQRIRELTELLKLPHSPNLHYSDAEKNRLALAAALMHKPSLLILYDVLSLQFTIDLERIFNFLRTLTDGQGLTVLLLNRTLLETRAVDMISVFGNGVELARGTPELLLRDSGWGFREPFDEYFKVGLDPALIEDYKPYWSTVAWDVDVIRESEIYDTCAGEDHTPAQSAGPDAPLEISTDGDTLLDSWRRILILTWFRLVAHRELCRAINLETRFIVIILITARCVLNTKLPYVPIAVSKLTENSTLVDSFVDHLSNRTSELRAYSNMNEAVASVERGENIAMIRVGQKFSTNPHYRISWRAAAANDGDYIREDSAFEIQFETHDQEMRHLFQKIVIDFVKAFRQTSPGADDVSCGQNITLQVSDPVYGSRLINNFEYFLPPFFLIIIFFFIMFETLETVLEHFVIDAYSLRFAFLGVKFHELIISCVLELLCILSVTVVLALVLLALSIWNDLLPMEGSLTPIVALFFTEGLCGITAGISVLFIDLFILWNFHTHRLLSVTFMTPLCYMIAWLPSPLFRFEMFRSVSDFLLHTGPTNSLRHILYNGWNLQRNEVLVGFITLAEVLGISLIWIIACAFWALGGRYYSKAILKSISKVVKQREKPDSAVATGDRD